MRNLEVDPVTSQREYFQNWLQWITLSRVKQAKAMKNQLEGGSLRGEGVGKVCIMRD